MMKNNFRNHSILKLKGISTPDFFGGAGKTGAQGDQQTYSDVMVLQSS